LPVSKDVNKLYQLHYMAFPLGLAFAHLYKKNYMINIKNKLVRMTKAPKLIEIIIYLLIILLFGIFGYTAVHSNVGNKIIYEHLTSLISMFALLFIVILKNIQSGLLITLGVYSYEIYLIQWPLMYRYDFVYKYTAPFLGTMIYIGIFIIFGFCLNRIVKKII